MLLAPLGGVAGTDVAGDADHAAVWHQRQRDLLFHRAAVLVAGGAGALPYAVAAQFRNDVPFEAGPPFGVVDAHQGMAAQLVQSVTVHRRVRGVQVDEAAVGIEDADRVLGEFDRLDHALRMLAQARFGLPMDAPQFQLVDDDVREILQRLALIGVQGRARPVVDDAQRAEVVTVGRDQRRTRVEADVRLRKDQRIVLEARILAGIGDDEKLVAGQRVLAEGHARGGFAAVEADTGLEPLPIMVDQADKRDRRVEQPRRQARHPVERQFGLAVEHLVGVERAEAVGLFLHGAPWSRHVSCPDGAFVSFSVQHIG